MELTYSIAELFLYFLIYSFMGWIVESCYYAIKNRHFYNKGFLNLPLCPSYGIVFALCLPILSTQTGNSVFQYLTILAVMTVTGSISDLFMKRMGYSIFWSREERSLFSGNITGLFFTLIMGGIYYLVYLLLHPFIFAGIELLPDSLIRLISVISFGILAVDFVIMMMAVHTGKKYSRHEKETKRFYDHLAEFLWKRLQHAYPGIDEKTEDKSKDYVFAEGLCFDKLVWVFLVSSFLGDIIETLFCRITGGVWMSRSSLLYGQFSVVWGIGAVVLTVALRRLVGKEDRYVFLAGCFIGGAYEYLCSVFTEVFFGTVFWDYSEMPLNIGGRTNVLYCFFWGILSVVWVKIIYPPMSRQIEKLPALPGKIFTWIVVLFMICNGLLSAAAMARYTLRQDTGEAVNVIEHFLDENYDDAFMEKRWPNMVVAKE
ncbi:MAG: hypothetical protein ACI4DN_01790 [Lachnospiraceae bacterium]